MLWERSAQAHVISTNVRLSRWRAAEYSNKNGASMTLSVRLLLEGRHTELVMREAVDEAVEKAKKSKPDLILLSLTMPRLNGAEAATVAEE